MSPEPDETAAESGAEGLSPQPAALLRAYVEHYGALVRFVARRLQCLAVARDLVQEVYLRIRRVPPDVVIDNPRAFVFQVAANLTEDHRRVEGRRAELLDDVQDLLWGPDEEISPERHLLAMDELAHLHRVLEQLPELSRLVFVLNRFECLTQREIATRLGISISTVEKHIRIALARLCDERRQYETEAERRDPPTPVLA